MLSPAIDTLDAEQAAIVVGIMRESGDLGRANRELQSRFPEWDLPQRLAALRQAQGMILAGWEKNPERKRRERLVTGHGREEHKETEAGS